MNVLVTGSAGLVGRAVVERLRLIGHHVTPIIRTSRAISGSEAVVADLSVQPLSQQVDTRPDALVHLAAAVPHTPYYPDNEMSAELTRLIDHNVAAAVRDWDIPVVYASSCGLYDSTDPREKDEMSMLVPRSPYFAAKRDGEVLFGELSKACTIRISAPYGSGLRRSLVLARFVEQARKDQPITLWGTGMREQDFLDTEDIADLVSIVLATQTSGVFNVCYGLPVTMKALAETVIDVVGHGSVCFADCEDPQEARVARYSTAKAGRELGWAPRTSLSAGLAKIKDLAFLD